MFGPIRFLGSMIVTANTTTTATDSPELHYDLRLSQTQQLQGPTWTTPVTDDFRYESDIRRNPRSEKQERQRVEARRCEREQEVALVATKSLLQGHSIKQDSDHGKKFRYSFHKRKEPVETWEEKPPFRLLDLPPELRAKILHYAVVESDVIDVFVLSNDLNTLTRHTKRSEGPGPYASSYGKISRGHTRAATQKRDYIDAIARGEIFIKIPLQPGVTRVSKQLREEALPLYYFHNRWRIYARPEHFMDIIYFFPQVDYLLRTADAETRYESLIQFIYRRTSSQNWHYIVACFRDVYEYRNRFPWLEHLFSTFAYSSVDAFVHDAKLAEQGGHRLMTSTVHYYDVLDHMLQLVIETPQSWETCQRRLERIRDAAWIYTRVNWASNGVRDVFSRFYNAYRYPASRKYILNLGNPRLRRGAKKFLQERGQIRQSEVDKVTLSIAGHRHQTRVSARKFNACKEIKVTHGPDGLVCKIELKRVGEIETGPLKVSDWAWLRKLRDD